MRPLITLLTFAMLIISPAAAQQISKPPRGSELRAELLDAARATFEKETAGEVEFVVRRLNVMGDWVFGEVKLQRPGGVPIDWSQTPYAVDAREGIFDPDASFFLLRRDGQGWSIVNFATGPTDVAWEEWRIEYNLPQELFTD